jgi:hypothetical protein
MVVVLCGAIEYATHTCGILAAFTRIPVLFVFISPVFYLWFMVYFLSVVIVVIVVILLSSLVFSI